MPITPDQEQEWAKRTGHCLYGPSSLPRIIACPASAQETLKMPLRPSSDYAEQGTKRHDRIARATTQDKLDPYTFIKRRMDLEPKEKNLVYLALDYYMPLVVNVTNIHTEKMVSLAPWGLPEIFGTTDKMWVDAEGTIHILDWKFGSGEQVFAEDNDQLLGYAAGSVGFPYPGNPKIVLHVVQPALTHFDKWETEYSYLVKWVNERLAPAIAAAKAHNPEFNPGEKQCRFCAARGTCKARHDKNQTNAVEVFSAVVELEKRVTQISPARLGALLHKAEELIEFCKSIQKYALVEALSGTKIPDWKVVNGRGSREWKDQKIAMKWLQEYAGMSRTTLYEVSPLSPSKVETINRSLKKDPDFAQLVEKKVGKPQLAPENDPRAEVIKTDAAAAFKGLEKGEDA